MSQIVYLEDSAYREENLAKLHAAQVRFAPPVQDVRDDQYCVPTAISAVTGIARGLISSMIFSLRKRARQNVGTKVISDGESFTKIPQFTAVGGVHEHESTAVLKQLLNKDCIVITRPPRLAPYGKNGWTKLPRFTLNKFVRDVTSKDPDGVYLVAVPGHMVAMKGDQIIDSVHPKGISVKAYGSRTGVRRYTRVGTIGETP